MQKDFIMYRKEYSNKKFWAKVSSVAKKAGIKVIYVALLLYYVLQDPCVPKADKAKIYGALGYFILPLDLIPDWVPVAGYGDDLAALMWAIHAVWANVTPTMKSKAKARLNQWFGDYDYTIIEDVEMEC
jgi:uncharacterized membrane protein YkvA (DUF1232 family)